MFGNNLDYGIGGMYQNPYPNMPNNGFGMQGFNSPTPPTQSVNTPPQPKPQGNMDWIYINSMQEADNVTVPANSKAWLMLTNDTVFGLKSANNLGVCTTEWFKFGPLEKKQEQTHYVTIEEVNALIDERLKETTPKAKKGGKADE